MVLLLSIVPCASSRDLSLSLSGIFTRNARGNVLYAFPQTWRKRKTNDGKLPGKECLREMHLNGAMHTCQPSVGGIHLPVALITLDRIKKDKTRQPTMPEQGTGNTQTARDEANGSNELANASANTPASFVAHEEFSSFPASRIRWAMMGARVRGVARVARLVTE